MSTQIKGDAEVTIKLLSNEKALIKQINKGLDGLQAYAAKGLEKSINVGRKIGDLRQIWNDRLSALYAEHNVDWKGFVAEATGRNYSWCARLVKAAKIADSQADVYQAFLADSETLGYSVSVEGLISFANGSKGNNAGNGKSDPADLIRYEGLQIKFKDGKFQLAKGNKAQVQSLIKFLKGIEKEL